MTRQPPESTRTGTLLSYTTLFRAQLRRAKSMGFDDAALDALKHPAMASLLANASVSWCSVSVNSEVLRRLLSQVDNLSREIEEIDRFLRLGAKIGRAHV